MRLIDADALKNYMAEKYVIYDLTFDDIDAQPTIDAVPREEHGAIVYAREQIAYDRGLTDGREEQKQKRGNWMAIGNTGLAACECGYITNRYSIYNYCPHCGAKMKSE